MTRDMLTDPRWLPEELGLPMPDDPHALAAALPLWEHNVRYEEGDEAVISAMQAAYPRFCLHPQVQQLREQCCRHSERDGLVFPSAASAERAAEYVRAHGGSNVRVTQLPGLREHTVTVPAEEYSLVRQYWQHSGDLLSSRAAADLLGGIEPEINATPERLDIRRRIAEIHNADADDVFLFPSGMAAIAAAWRTMKVRRPAGSTIQFGFPYVDTLKIQERFPGSTHQFLPIGDDTELRQLTNREAATDSAALASQAPLAGLFCEVPSNPLLTCPDVAALRRFTEHEGAVFLIDGTLGACGNLTLLPHCDLLAVSLTKYFSGYGNVLAGALIINRRSPIADELNERIRADFEELLCDQDVGVLSRNSRDLESRVTMINRNAVRLAAFLNGHESVESVFHPSIQKSQSYESLRRRADGYGGLMSVVLRNAEHAAPLVYDRLRVCKGPNLGTNFTLCCPYTILAHYEELEFAESCGVSPFLLRISVGTEPFEDLQERFSDALSVLPEARTITDLSHQ